MKIGEEIKRDRLAAGLSQQALADAAGKCRLTVINLEAGRTDPKQSTVKALRTAIKRAQEQGPATA